MFHRSQRLLLRPIWPEDWQGVLAGIADEGVVRNLSSVPWPYGEHHAREFAARPVEPFVPALSDHSRPRRARWSAASASVRSSLWGQTELGYWIARPSLGTGVRHRGGAGPCSALPRRWVTANWFSAHFHRQSGLGPSAEKAPVFETHRAHRGAVLLRARRDGTGRSAIDLCSARKRVATPRTSTSARPDRHKRRGLVDPGKKGLRAMPYGQSQKVNA